MSQWASLFDQAVSIINQANSAFPVMDSRSFGGGTAMMLQIDHRESYDIDLFIDNPQVLPYLNPSTQGYTLDLDPNEYKTDTAVTWLAMAGCTIPEICSITRHSLKSAHEILKHYLALNEELANSAMAKMVKWFDDEESEQ